MEPDFKVKVEESGKSSNEKIDIAIFEPSRARSQ
jgi:type I restriction enzyme M protein